MKSQDRFKALVHYVCDLCDDPTKLGATKLNKVLWYADTFAYRLHGRTISGETAYVKRQFGPVPKNVLKAVRALEADGAIQVRERDFFGKSKKEYIVLKQADGSIFDDEQKQIVKQVVDIICREYSATSISDLSHDRIWEAAELGEEIPVYAVLAAQTAPLTESDMAWADKIISERHARAS